MGASSRGGRGGRWGFGEPIEGQQPWCGGGEHGGSPRLRGPWLENSAAGRGSDVLSQPTVPGGQGWTETGVMDRQERMATPRVAVNAAGPSLRTSSIIGQHQEGGSGEGCARGRRTHTIRTEHAPTVTGRAWAELGGASPCCAGSGHCPSHAQAPDHSTRGLCGRPARATSSVVHPTGFL